MNIQAPTEKRVILRDDARAQGLIRYFSGTPCMRGHVSERIVSSGTCVVCNRENVAALRLNDPEKARDVGRVWYADNAERCRNKSRSYYANNKEKALESSAAYRNANRDLLAARRKVRRENDPVFAFNARARCAVRSALTLYGHKKNSKTEQILGCTMAEFRFHIERQFLPGMGWNNMHLWEIDHIIAASTATTQQEAEALNKASNLRPLWMRDNRSKSAKKTHLL